MQINRANTIRKKLGGVCQSRFAGCLYFSSQAFARKVEKLAVKCWQPAGIGPSHGYLLLVVLNEPGVQPTLLCEQLQLTPSTITRLIEKLEEKKLVKRTTDGKQTNVFPTEIAKQQTELYTDCVQQFSNAYIQLLGAQQSKALVESLCTLSDRLPV